jgi:hypothetical protein
LVGVDEWGIRPEHHLALPDGLVTLLQLTALLRELLRRLREPLVVLQCSADKGQRDCATFDLDSRLLGLLGRLYATRDCLGCCRFWCL